MALLPVRRPLLVVLVASLGLYLAACSGSAEPASPTAKPPAATATATPAAAPTSASKPAATPTAAPGAPASAPAASGSAPAPAGSVRLNLVDGTEARFRAREQLAGRGLNEAVGKTTAVTGGVVLDPNGAVVTDQSKIVVDVRTLKSDESRRDNFIHRNTLESDKFPNAQFVVKEIRGLAFPLPTAGEATFQLVGEMTAHGVTKPLTWQVTAQFSGQEISGLATTDFKLTEFGMSPPTVGPVLGIEDPIKLEIQFKAARAATAGADTSAGQPAAPSDQSTAAAPPAAAPSRGSAATVNPVHAASPPAAVATTCSPTREDALGPFYKPNAPQRASVGTGYVLTGVVRSSNGCGPIPGG